MSTTIHAGAMPEALTNLLTGSASGTAVKPSAGLGFLDLAVREVGKRDDENKDTGFLRDQMNLQQYKKYISGRISAIRIDPSRALESLAVQISDAGFQAMKDDPEYEAWVLETLENAWSVPQLGAFSSAYTTYSIGADRESFRTHTVDLRAELDAMEKLDEEETETFWERRHRHHEEYMELARRAALLRRMGNGTVSAAELLLGGLL